MYHLLYTFLLTNYIPFIKCRILLFINPIILDITIFIFRKTHIFLITNLLFIKTQLFQFNTRNSIYSIKLINLKYFEYYLK